MSSENSPRRIPVGSIDAVDVAADVRYVLLGVWEDILGTEKAGEASMAELLWFHFSDHQTIDDSGKCSFIGVFDSATVGLRVSKEAPDVQFPLSSPVPTASFVLTLHIQARPSGEEIFEVKVCDSDGQRVMPTVRGKIGANANGQHNLHLRFANGLPVSKPGIYTFEVSVSGASVGSIDLPVDIVVQRGKE